MICITPDSDAVKRCAEPGSSGRGLRAWIAAFAVLLLAPAGAAAQDLDALRGTFSGPAVNWAGVYLGAQVGVSSMNTDFSSAGSNLVANMLANSTVEAQASPSDWPVLTNSTSSTSRNYGLFFGYNTQMEQLVLGFDLNYNYNQSLQTSDGPKSFERVVATTDGTSHDVKITSQASLKLIDYATARFRAGYAFGQFLPYAVIGAAAGRFNYAINVSLTDTQTDSNGNISVYAPAPESNAKNNAIVAGFVAGLGMDVALAPNIFLRGEWEFINFASIGGIRSNMNSGRVGIGVKF